MLPNDRSIVSTSTSTFFSFFFFFLIIRDAFRNRTMQCAREVLKEPCPRLNIGHPSFHNDSLWLPVDDLESWGTNRNTLNNGGPDGSSYFKTSTSRINVKPPQSVVRSVPNIRRITSESRTARKSSSISSPFWKTRPRQDQRTANVLEEYGNVL